MKKVKLERVMTLSNNPLFSTFMSKPVFFIAAVYYTILICMTNSPLSLVADKFTVPSFLEALEDSVSGTLQSSESRQDEELRSHTQSSSDPMDEDRQ